MNAVTSLYRLLFAHSMFRRMNTAIYSMALHGLGVMNFENDNVSGERYLIHHYLPRHIKSARPVFFDVGANVGTFTAQLLVAVPHACVYAFEPHPKNFARLRNAGHPPDRVQYNNIALGDVPGYVTLYDRADYEGSAHASVFQDVISDIHRQEVTAVEVPVDTLDNIAATNNVTYIDYLKIDTEGNELAVLQGATRLLREGRIGLIHFEFNSTNVVSKVFMRDFRRLLADYTLYRLLPRGLLPLDSGLLATEIFGYQNILAVPVVR